METYGKYSMFSKSQQLDELERFELLIVCFTMEAGMLGMSSIQYSNYVIILMGGLLVEPLH